MSIVCWLQNSLTRVYPTTEAFSCDKPILYAARNEKISFQACVRNIAYECKNIQTSVVAPEILDVTIRRVGYVPVAHFNTDTPSEELDGLDRIPGYVPDPLFHDDTAIAGPLETHSFWINLAVSENATPGSVDFKVIFKVDNEVISELESSVYISEIVLSNKTFPVTHWFYADALCDWYTVNAFDERFWSIVEPYMANLTSHGNNCMYVPIFTPPTDGVKRPTQLLKVESPSKDIYNFDFNDVKRWVDLARKCGAQMFEWTHLFSQWGVKYALRIYRDNNDDTSLLWEPETSATSTTYRNFLTQFLPEFYNFLMREDLIGTSLFHVSDEPHGDEHLQNYRDARAMLKELAPWMKVADALSDIRYGIEGLTDIPIPSIAAASEYNKAGIPAWTYFCCGPRGKYLNRFLDTPLAKIRMSGWLFYRHDAKGFLHWGYNYWYKSQTRELIDPFTELCGGVWPSFGQGDPFVVYPGPDGPIDSIRWEVFAESLNDYALLQTVNTDRNSSMLSDIQSYDEFPKNAEWIMNARKSILDAKSK
ncbi:MAG: DUF4091 domain-containing protein [Armatimonadota bacterium]